jgi:hypothetical protein
VHEEHPVADRAALRGKGRRRHGAARGPGRQRPGDVGTHLAAQHRVDLHEEHLRVPLAHLPDRGAHPRRGLVGWAPAVVGEQREDLGVGGRRAGERDGDPQAVDREGSGGVGRAGQVVRDDGQVADDTGGGHSGDDLLERADAQT